MLEPFLFLIALCVSIGGLMVLDKRFKLALFFDRKRTVKTLVIMVLFFIIWDLAGIALQIFHVGTSPYLTGLRIAPEFHIEELFFLVLLNYTALILWRGGEKLWPHT